MKNLLHFTRSHVTRALCLCLVATSLAACGTIDTAPYQGRAVRRTTARPYFADRADTIRMGAHIATNPYDRPYLRQPAGRHPQAPPYGRAVSVVIGAHLRGARIPSAPATSTGGTFDAVANIYPGPLRQVFGRDGVSAETPFEIEFRDASGRATSRIQVTGYGTARNGYGDPVRLSLDDAGTKIARAISEASHTRPTAGDGVSRPDADALSNAGVARFQSEDYSGALQYFDESIQSNPSHQAAWTYRGATLVKMGRSEEGRQSLERAVSIQPTSAEAEQARKWLTRL